MNKRLFWHKKDVEEVMDLLLLCKSREEIEGLFDRILTPREINDIARRYKVLKMIDKGSSYADIITETGMSSVTVSRISAKCGYGFQKSSGLKLTKRTAKQGRSAKLKYKGVKVRG